MTLSLFPTSQTGPDFEQLAKDLEAWETPPWAAEAILDVEILTPRVIDPCVCRGHLAKAALARGYQVDAFDIHPWGYEPCTIVDFLTYQIPDPDQVTIFMNPPFSKAVDFVRHMLAQGVRKVVCFQRFAWYESVDRRPFWEHDRPPNRVHVCESRADCWLASVPPEERNGGQSSAHAWYVWERGHPPGALLGRLHKGK